MARLIIDIAFGAPARRVVGNEEMILRYFCNSAFCDAVEYCDSVGDGMVELGYRGMKVLLFLREPDCAMSEYGELINQSAIVIVAFRAASAKYAETLARYHGLAKMSLKVDNPEYLPSRCLNAFHHDQHDSHSSGKAIAESLLAGFLLEVIKWVASLV